MSQSNFVQGATSCTSHMMEQLFTQLNLSVAETKNRKKESQKDFLTN